MSFSQGLKVSVHLMLRPRSQLEIWLTLEGFSISCQHDRKNYPFAHFSDLELDHGPYLGQGSESQ